MVTRVAKQSLTQMTTINYPRKLIRAMTYNSLLPTITGRKRLLSEQNERHDSMTQFFNDDRCANKRFKTELLPNDSNEKNQHHVLSSSIFSSLCSTTQRSSLCKNQRRRSFTYINGVSHSQSTIVTQLSTITKSTTNNMLVFQQSPVIENNNENEQEIKTTSSIFVTSAELSAYMNSDIFNQNDKLLIIDCGLPLRYNERRITNSFLLSINDKLSRKRLTTRGLKNFLDQNQLKRFDQSEIIILYDDSIHSTSCSSNQEQQISSIIKCIINEIKGYDATKKIHVLQSTFDEFYQQYPTYCYAVPLNHIHNSNEDSLSTPTIDIDLFEMSEIIPGLFLGNANDAQNINLLEQNQIKRIINISKTIPCHFKDDQSFKYLQFLCNDSAVENILQYFDEAFDYITKNLSSNQKVLVHCQGGISRSPSFVIGYLMKFHSKTFSQAYSFVKKKREIISPNFSFLAQLERYEKMIKPMVQ